MKLLNQIREVAKQIQERCPEKTDYELLGFYKTIFQCVRPSKKSVNLFCLAFTVSIENNASNSFSTDNISSFLHITNSQFNSIYAESMNELLSLGIISPSFTDKEYYDIDSDLMDAIIDNDLSFFFEKPELEFYPFISIVFENTLQAYKNDIPLSVVLDYLPVLESFLSCKKVKLENLLDRLILYIILNDYFSYPKFGLLQIDDLIEILSRNENEKQHMKDNFLCGNLIKKRYVKITNISDIHKKYIDITTKSALLVCSLQLFNTIHKQKVLSTDFKDDNPKSLFSNKNKKEDDTEEREVDITDKFSKKDDNFFRIKNFSEIKPETLFYSDDITTQIENISKALLPENLKKIQQKLENMNLGKGIIISLSGAPGVGKTSLAMQLCRKSERNVCEVNMANMRSCWVGESEKNVQQMFDEYQKIVEDCKKSAQNIPVLFMNEADTLLSVRHNLTPTSNSYSDNQVQNILLTNLENFEGILILTSNFEVNGEKRTNFDEAFSRRITFKLSVPESTEDVRCKILTQKYLVSKEEAEKLAKYNLQPGAISNVFKEAAILEVISEKNKLSFSEKEKLFKNEVGKSITTKIGFCY